MPIKWKKTLISFERFESAGVFDVTGDGKPNIVSGAWWYETPDIATQHRIGDVMAEGEYYDDFSTIPMDVNGNGRLDFITGGWWGDTFLETGSSLGSRLWLLRREKLTAATRQRARDYALEALQWLIDDRIASDVEIETAVPERGCLELSVVIVREGETPTRFQYLWEGF